MIPNNLSWSTLGSSDQVSNHAFVEDVKKCGFMAGQGAPMGGLVFANVLVQAFVGLVGLDHVLRNNIL